MVAISLLEQFQKLGLSERMTFFEAEDSITESMAATELFRFLKAVIQNRNENSYVQLLALRRLTESVVIKRLSPRHGVSVLVDEWDGPEELFLEIQRLRDLFLLYESAEDEIDAVLLEAQAYSEPEIISEANFRFGLIRLQRALGATKEHDAIDQFEYAKEAFFRSETQAENRVDCKFFIVVCDCLVQLINGRDKIAAQNILELGELIVERDAFSFAKWPEPMLLGFYRALSAIHSLKSEMVSEWLDYRTGFGRLLYLVNEIKSEQLLRRLNEGAMQVVFKRFVDEKVLHPYYSMSFSAEISRIDARLNETDSTPELRTFLTEVRDLASDSEKNKKVDRSEFRASLVKALPNRSIELIDFELSKVRDNSMHEYMEVFARLSSRSHSTFLDDLIWACLTLQKDVIYQTNALENDRNTQIANLLSAKDYRVRDQTLRGRSFAGKSAGELDIFIEDLDGLPFSIIEALNLDSMRKDYVASHLDKIFRYDTAGIPSNNVILVYSDARDFEELWKRYAEFVKAHNFQYKLCSVTEDPLYSDLKLLKGIHLRNGQEVMLSHVMINMRS